MLTRSRLRLFKHTGKLRCTKNDLRPNELFNALLSCYLFSELIKSPQGMNPKRHRESLTAARAIFIRFPQSPLLFRTENNPKGNSI
jgi:hypothetical protein